MFSKLVLTTATLSTASALRLQTKVGAFSETCSYPLQRLLGNQATTDWNKYKDSSTPYEDADFPADNSSLYWGPKFSKGLEQPKTYKEDPPLGWMRPKEMQAKYMNMKSDPSLWGKNDVQPNGTVQGELGDCWFLAASSALAEWPERVHKLFTNKEYSKSGIFELNFYHMTKPVKVVVDDRLALYKQTKWDFIDTYMKTYPMNANKGINDGWWQAILEKAYAKMNVNYSQLNGGDPNVAWRDMTNMPVSGFQIHDKALPILRDQIKQWNEKQYAMTADCQVKGFGLFTKHVYSVLGTVQLTDGPILIKMRNPHGKELYKGPFHDKDSRWTEQWKKDAGMKVANDGIFFMEMKGFYKHFKSMQVVHYQDWDVAQKEVTGKKGPIVVGSNTKEWVFRLKPAVDTKIIIMMDMQNSRQQPHGCPKADSKYIWYQMIVDKASVWKDFIYNRKGFLSHEIDAKAGIEREIKIINMQDEIGADFDHHFILSAYTDKGNGANLSWIDGRIPLSRKKMPPCEPYKFRDVDEICKVPDCGDKKKLKDGTCEACPKYTQLGRDLRSCFSPKRAPGETLDEWGWCM